MFCSNCGNKCDDNAFFCKNCGSRLADFIPTHSEPTGQTPAQQLKKLYFDAKGLTLFNYVFEIKDEFGNVRYRARTVSESLVRYNAQLLDANNCEVIKVSQQSKLTMASMNFDFLDPQGNLITEAIQNFQLFNYTYDLKRFGITASGNFLKMSFDFHKNGVQIAHIDKKILSWGDCYELTYSDPNLEQILLASVLMIQLVCAANRSRRRRR